MTLTGPRLVDGGAVTWWFAPRISAGPAAAMGIFYLGMLLLCGAWLGLGVRLHRTPDARPSDVWLVAGLWCVPLLVGPALFSSDVYSYLAQGTILHIGLDPYRVAPVVLAAHGHAHVLAAVSPFWRRTTAPYGPLFLALMSGVVGATGSHLVAGVVFARVLELAGVVLVAVFVPRVARSTGADPSRATWLTAACPLVLLELVAAGHNDALMAGFMVAGVAFALERRPHVAVVLCALAATIKLPAAAAVLLVAFAWSRTLPSRGSRLRFAATAAAEGAAVLVAVSAATGLGLGWLSTTVLSTPAKVRLAVTPVTALGWSAASALHAAGAHVSARGLESAFSDVALAGVAIIGIVQLRRVTMADLVARTGILLLAAALGGPAAWPWYFTWALVLLAAWPAAQRSHLALPLALALSVALVKPDGILALPLDTSPLTLAAYVGTAVVLFTRFRRGRRLHEDAVGVNPRSAHASPALADP